MSSEHVTMAAGPARAQVDAHDGGRITSLTVGDLELLGGAGDDVVGHGSFLMAPWAGRIRDGQLRVDGKVHRLPTDRTHPHAGHGLVMDRPWSVLAAGGDRVHLRCDLDERWPWPGHVETEIVLHADRIDQRVAVHAHAEAFPATVGWHPWFPRQLTRGAPAEFDLPAEGMLRRDAAGIPDGTVVAIPPGPWDDCFVGVRWPVTVRWPGALELEIDSDAPDAVVFDELPGAFCVEPQSGPPDGPNTDPRWVRRDEPLRCATSWRWRVLPAG